MSSANIPARPPGGSRHPPAGSSPELVFAPEATAALRAALDNQLQRSINLCLGASASTIGLTVPAILGVGLATGKTMVLGLDPSGVTLLALTLVLSTLTFSGPRTTVLGGECTWSSSLSTSC